MTKTVLMTLGRLPKALDLARSFALAGIRVVVAEPFRWHLARVSNAVTRSVRVTAPSQDRDRYLRDIAAVVDTEGVDLVVPVSEETMYVSALKDQLPRGVRMFTMPQDRLLTLHNKYTFITTSAALGLDVPETYVLDDPRAAALTETCDFVVKPVFSCSGRGVKFYKKGAALPAGDPIEKYIVQKRVSGNLYSTFSIAHEGRTLVTVIYRAAVLSGTVAVCFERIAELPAITAWVKTFTFKTNYSGFVSFDFVAGSDGRAFAIECNPRMTSGAHFVHPEDLAPAVINPEMTTPVRFRDTIFMQQLYPCLTETQKSIFDRALFKRNLGYLLKARDVTWSVRDPLPLLTMPMTAYQIIGRSITRGESFGEASTFDISWREPLR